VALKAALEEQMKLNATRRWAQARSVRCKQGLHRGGEYRTQSVCADKFERG
jgi:hypothetical protein